ncbi:DUF937 domain-containing protein [Deinococcus sedimenti]|uniref:DUF937 domain-containing protein n=1 Tax=Deinococcus sedimenti TaxID=1867090 RepID=A0ABQ2S6D5_9DEIO|nr:DUF937 domain-containing protein [Deinococcus sedimenti]GGR99095.1 hypothetical protein GCM10008960_27180 [Deinococcus sedimenti]
MNFVELLHSFFDDSGVARLAQAADLDADRTRRLLDAGLPLQLDALAAQAGTPTGPHIAEAVASLPPFDSVAAVLNEPDGASNLQQAGELLAPALLGDRAGTLARQVAGQAGTSEEDADRVLQLTLPLLLSLLGRAGLSSANVTPLLNDLSGQLRTTPPIVPVPGLDEMPPVTPESLVTPAPPVTPEPLAAPAGVGSDRGALDALTGPALLEWLRAQLSGAAGEKVGVAAGYSASGAGRATQAALPVLLAALVRRAGTNVGAQDLLDRSGATRDLVDDGGNLNTALLADPAETARLEGQGRALLGTLFPNLNPVAGRLGSALGSSGANATRLLALLAPLLLALLGARARAGSLAAQPFGTLLASLNGHLWGLLPAGMSGLNALLDHDVTAGAPPAAPAAAVPVAATPVTPVTTTPPPPPAPVPVERRRGFPWWIIPLLLLLGLGGCWLVNQNRTDPPAATGEAAASILVTNPTSGADLPAEPFTMSGTGPANADLTISDQGQEVGKATVGADGAWSAELPAPTPGEHTYSVDGGGGRSELKVNVTDASAGTEGTGTGSTEASTTETSTTETSGTDTGGTDTTATFAISEPAADATLPAGTFTLRGTGTAGQQVELFEDDTSLGNLTIGEDGTWSFDVPSPTAGAHTYALRGPDGTDLGTVTATISAPDATASAADCTKDYTLSITDGQTVNEPFRFGGVGEGRGYSVTVRRGARVIGTKDVPLDATCGWSYQSRPGPGQITYEVRPLGDAAAAPLSTVNLTVGQ